MINRVKKSIYTTFYVFALQKRNKPKQIETETSQVHFLQKSKNKRLNKIADILISPS